MSIEGFVGNQSCVLWVKEVNQGVESARLNLSLLAPIFVVHLENFSSEHLLLYSYFIIIRRLKPCEALNLDLHLPQKIV